MYWCRKTNQDQLPNFAHLGYIVFSQTIFTISSHYFFLHIRIILICNLLKLQQIMSWIKSKLSPINLFQGILVQFLKKCGFFKTQNTPDSGFTLDVTTLFWVLCPKSNICHHRFTKIKHVAYNYILNLQFHIEVCSFGVHENFRHFFQNQI